MGGTAQYYSHYTHTYTHTHTHAHTQINTRARVQTEREKETHTHLIIKKAVCRIQITYIISFYLSNITFY